MAGGLSFIKGACSQILLVAVLYHLLHTSEGGACSRIWENPCHKEPQIPKRHMRSAITDRQLNTLTHRVKFHLKELKKLYKMPKMPNVKSNCPKLSKIMGPVRHAKNITTANHEFYNSLIKFSIFLDKLQKTRLSTEHNFNRHARKILFDETCNDIKQTICEFKDSIMRDYQVPQSVLERPVHVNTMCVPRHANLSQLQMFDFQFFKKLNRFVKQSNTTVEKIQKKMRRKQNKLKNRKKNSLEKMFS